MGTRSLICVFYKGRFVIAQYTEYDGYPKGQGIDILKFLLKQNNIENLKDGLQYIFTPDPEDEAKDINRLQEVLQKIEKYIIRLCIRLRKVRRGIPDQFIRDCIKDLENYINKYIKDLKEGPINKIWPSLSHLTGAKILDVVAKATARKRVPIELDLEFANDWIYCEWAYVVDLDKDVFEVYKGAQPKKKDMNNRFYSVGGENDTVPVLVKSFPFAELTTKEEFLAALKKDDEEEDDEEGDSEGEKTLNRPHYLLEI